MESIAACTARWSDASVERGSGGDGMRDGRLRAPMERWAEQLPLTQRYPSHLQRVLAPASQGLASPIVC